MINKVEFMLYVDDVENISKFWEEAFSAKIEERDVMPDNSVSIRISILENVVLRLFNKEFIKKFSPEVSLSIPSIMFYTNNIELLHENISKLGVFTSSIEEFNGNKQFNFCDYEKNYFAVSEI